MPANKTMRTQLLPHNKTAYTKVMKILETSDRTCVVHPTGTGKSYLIAAVSESFKRVLILGPNKFVLRQVQDVLRWRKHGVEYMTYAMVMVTENPHTDYDLICLDEFHRAGAQEWGEAVNRFLSLNKNAKVFGTTATNIRYLDNERNMAKELFNDNVASHITIANAWNMSILPIPRYVCGLFRWDKTVKDAHERIERSRSLSPEEKRQRIFRLTNAHLHWELSYGMPAILRKHLDKNTRRVIVFCGSIEQIEQMRQEVVGWFKEAGFTVASTCLIHSNLSDREQREQMERFEDDSDKGVKLMFSVNMLNEGVHVPNVNAVLMLRTTQSRIIYMQQLGRCLTTANTEKPLVLDMVDNITTTTAINDLQGEFDDLEKYTAEREGREPRKFEVKDYTLGVRDLIEKLVPKEHVEIPYEERLERFIAFCNEHNRIPTKKKDYDEFLNFIIVLGLNRKNPDQRFLEIYRKYKPEKESDEELLKRLLDFVTENDRLPRFCEKPTPYERNLYYLVRLRLKNHPKVKELWEKYSQCSRIPFDERLKRLVDFVNEHHRLPKKSERKAYNNFWALRAFDNGTNETLNRIIAQYGTRFKDIHVKMKVLDFYAEHGRLPGRGKSPEENALYSLFIRRLDGLSDDPEISKLLEGRVEGVKKDEKIRRVQEFCEKNGRKPMPEDGRIFKLWECLSSYAQDPRVKDIRKKYATKRMSPEDKIRAMQEYTAKHGDRPPQTDTKDYHIWHTMLQLCKDDPRVKEMRKKYIGKSNSEDRILAIQDYLSEHGRCPTKQNDRLHWAWKKIVRENIDDPRVKALYDKYGIKRVPFEEQMKRVREFTEANGRKPMSSDGEIYRMWKNLINHKRADPRVQEMLDKYGNRTSIEDKIVAMQQFTEENGRRPKQVETKMYSMWRHMISEAKDDSRVQEMKRKYRDNLIIVK